MPEQTSEPETVAIEGLHDRLLEIHECGETLEGTKRELWKVIENLEEKLEEGENDA